MKIKFLLPCIAILPAVLFAFKPADVKESENSFKSLPIVQSSTGLIVGEGTVAVTKNSNISTDYSTGVSSVRTKEESAIIATLGLQNDFAYTSDVISLHE